MYLFIYEDGEMRVGNTITDDDYQASNDGILDIVRAVFSYSGRYYLQYDNGEWHKIAAL